MIATANQPRVSPEQIVRSNGVDLCAQTFGDPADPTILLIHGAATPMHGWDGGYGTSWYVDPKEDLIGILLTQRVFDSPSGPAVVADIWTAAYAAIDD